MNLATHKEPAFSVDRTLLRQLMGEEWFAEMLRFIRDARFGSFTVVLQDGKVIGYDELVKRRATPGKPA
ncbi:MAG: YezD family protein [Bacillota bacterium]